MMTILTFKNGLIGFKMRKEDEMLEVVLKDLAYLKYVGLWQIETTKARTAHLRHCWEILKKENEIQISWIRRYHKNGKAMVFKPYMADELRKTFDQLVYDVLENLKEDEEDDY
jgi:hypothetical protein